MNNKPTNLSERMKEMEGVGKRLSKEEILNSKREAFFYVDESCVDGDVSAVYEAMEEYLQQEIEDRCIGFGDFIKDNHYYKSETKGWYKGFEHRADFPAGFSMMSTAYEFYTTKELFQLYLNTNHSFNAPGGKSQ